MVDIAISNSKGELIISIGDMERIVFPRSAIKPFQCLALASLNPNVTEKEYSVICSSHNGQDEHVNVVNKFISKNDLSLEDLICGPHWSLDKKVFINQVRRFEKPMTILSNCSGKHSGMLLLSKLLNAENNNYEILDHPVQLRIVEIISKLAGHNILEFPHGIDGCGVPAFSAPIKIWAKAFARFASGDDISEELNEGRKIISNAIANEPIMIAGERRICTVIAKDLGHKITPKMGAEGVYCCSLNDKGLGLIMKCRDGSRRAVEFALGEVLKILDYSVSNDLNKYFDDKVYNIAGREVGLKKIKLLN